MFDYFDIDAPTNYLGALLFWLYIILALTFTFVAISTLLSLNKTSTSKNYSLVYLFSFYAVSSFCTLSVTMLSVLIKSYTDWTVTHHLPLPSSLLGHNGLLSFHGQRQQVWIWQWSITSSLFRDFAEAILEGQGRVLWMNAGLVSTLYTTVWMGVQGAYQPLYVGTVSSTDKETGHIRIIPNLWAFFALLEILPTSFTLNLFLVALSLNPPLRNKTHTYTRPAQRPSLVKSAYLLLLLILPTTARSTLLVPSIFLIRGLLLWPLFVDLISPSITKPVKENESNDQFLLSLGTEGPGTWYETGLTVLLMGLGVGALIRSGPGGIWMALNSHPAIGALGWDVLIWGVSWGTWKNVTGRRSRSKSA